MKRVILLILLFSFFLGFYSREGKAQMENIPAPFINRLKVGVRVGPTWGITSHSGDSPFMILSSRASACNAGGTMNGQVTRRGLTAGVYGVIDLKKNISWKTEVGFLSKNSRDYYELIGWDSLYNVPFDYSGKTYHILNYIEFPNMISFNAPWYSLKPYFSAGLSPCILLNAVKKDDYISFSGSDESKNALIAAGFPLEDRKSKIDAKPFNLQLLFAAGNNARLSKSVQLNFEVRYYFDLMKTFNYSYGSRTSSINFMNLCIQTGLVYNFSKDNELISQRDKVYQKYKTRQLKAVPVKAFPLNNLSFTVGLLSTGLKVKDFGGAEDYSISAANPSRGISFGLNYAKSLNNKFFVETGMSVAWNGHGFNYTSSTVYSSNNVITNNTLNVPIGFGFQKDLFTSKRIKLATSAGPKFHFLLKGLSNLNNNDTLNASWTNGQFDSGFILNQTVGRTINPGGYIKTTFFIRLGTSKFLSFSIIGQYFFEKPIANYEIYSNGSLSANGNLSRRNQSISGEIAYSFLQFRSGKKKK